jgi:hypothetical protein
MCDVSLASTQCLCGDRLEGRTSEGALLANHLGFRAIFARCRDLYAEANELTLVDDVRWTLVITPTIHIKRVDGARWHVIGISPAGDEITIAKRPTRSKAELVVELISGS